MFGWFKRKSKAVTVLQPTKSKRLPPSYHEVMAAKRRRAKARRKQHKAA